MKVICQKAEIAAHLAHVSEVIPSKDSGRPIVKNVLIVVDAEEQSMSLTGFDMINGINSKFNAQVEEGGATTVPAKLLSDVIGKMRGGEISLTLEGAQLIVKSGPMRFALGTTPAEDYPEVPVPGEGRSVQIPAEILKEGAKSTSFAVSDDKAKSALTGVHIWIREDEVEFAAIDGHRMSVSRYKTPMVEEGVPFEPFSAIIPSEALKALGKLAFRDGDQVVLCLDSAWIILQWGGVCISSRLIDGQYPHYSPLIPTDSYCEVIVDRATLVSSLDFVDVANEQYGRAKVSIESGKMVISMTSDGTDAVDTLEVATIGGSPTFGIRTAYLKQGLKHFGSKEVRIRIGTAKDGPDTCKQIVVIPAENESEDGKWPPIGLGMTYVVAAMALGRG